MVGVRKPRAGSVAIPDWAADLVDQGVTALLKFGHDQIICLRQANIEIIGKRRRSVGDLDHLLRMIPDVPFRQTIGWEENHVVRIAAAFVGNGKAKNEGRGHRCAPWLECEPT